MDVARVAVAIMAKAPRAGEVKTRLCPPLSPEQAAGLYRCFLQDKITQVRVLGGVSPIIAFTPQDSRSLFEELAPDFRLLAQRGPDLGSRLANTVATLLQDGHPAAVLIDSDTPNLPTDFLGQAVDLLTSPATDLVLGPSDDGGYYLVGLRRLWPILFERMPWSTADVLPETLRRAEATGLRISCLPPWFDVDTPEDLDRLMTALASRDDQGSPHTRQFLARQGL